MTRAQTNFPNSASNTAPSPASTSSWVPNWKGDTPAGITAVVRSSTALAFAVPRVFMDDTPEDRAAIQPLLSQINVYPLSQFDGKMKTKDWSKLPHFPAPKSTGKGETQVGQSGNLL